MLTVGGAKMAKSDGNFVTVRDALAKAPGEVIRLALLMTHYRDPLDWTEDRLRQARQTLDQFYRALEVQTDGNVQHDTAQEWANPIVSALRDDLNVPLALSELHKATTIIHWYDKSAADDRATRQEVLRIGGKLMGLLRNEPKDWFQGRVCITEEHASETDQYDAVFISLEQRIGQCIGERAQARRERRFTDADRIRDELAAEGVILEDHPDGTTTWRKA
jgi:cysteinyl-tRNA synthetase